MNNIVKLCIFDLDGLLINTEEEVWVVKAQIASEYAAGTPFPVEFLHTLMGMNQEVEQATILKTFGNDYPVEKYYKKLYQLYDDYVANETPTVKKGAFELLDFLKENKIKCAVSTSSDRGPSTTFLTRTKLLPYFDNLVCNDDIVHGKPNPEVFLKNAQHFNVDPKNAIVFEDGHVGSQAALSGGFPLIIVPDLCILPEQDKTDALAVIESLDKAIPIIKEINSL